MKKAIILLGSNFDSLENINKAKAFLVEIFGNVLFSRNIESEAVGNAKGIFLNSVAIIETACDEKHIIEELKKIETFLGRTRSNYSKEIVSIDLDLVQYDALILRPEDAARHYYRLCLKDLGL